MKKLFLTILSLCLMASAWAYDFSSGGFYFRITSSKAPYTVAVTSPGRSYAAIDPYLSESDMTIPSTVTYNNTGITYNVTSIDNAAFKDLYSKVASYRGTAPIVTIPSTVTSIGDSAFYQCDLIKTINIPSSVTKFGTLAFAYCTDLITVNNNASITELKEFTFIGCNKMTTANIPSTVKTIGYAAFAWCSKLASIIIPNSVDSMGTSVFDGCNALSSVTLSTALKEIPDNTFFNCGLKNVTIPSNVKTIGKGAFKSCQSMTSVIFPSSITTIGVEAFFLCNQLTSATLGNSVTSIGASAFGSCTALSTVTIPSSVTSIGSSAFGYCTALSSIYDKRLTPVDLSTATTVFDQVNKNTCVLHVPTGKESLYAGAVQWKDFLNIKGDVTAVFNATASKLKINTSNGKAEISGLPQGASVAVYNLQGAAIYSQKATEESVSLNLPARGVYVVKVGNESVKLIY
jgi:hypothetical protein